MTIWFQIKVNDVVLSPALTFTFFSQLHKNELHISPHVKLAGYAKEAHIATEKLAQEFLDRCLPIFKKRYGKDTYLSINEWSSNGRDKYLLKRIQNDTAIVKARLKQNNMAPNKKVIM